MTQVDVLESGRSITHMTARDLEQMVASSFNSTNPLVSPFNKGA